MKGGSSDLYSLLFLLLSYSVLCSANTRNCEDGSQPGFTDLKAAPDLRSVRLSWKYSCYSEPLGFIVKVCERARRDPSYFYCFERVFGKDVGRGLRSSRDILRTDRDGSYFVVVHDLRMMTDYTAAIEPVPDENFLFPPEDTFNSRWQHTPRAKTSFITKGFSAYVRKCHFNSSEIVVHTGPFFGGKISVEDVPDARCGIYGDRNSSKDVYILHIDHDLCSSEVVNGSSVRTIVSIHESSSIVTLNSRKFLVQCNFLPETFTVEAAFKIPQHSDSGSLQDSNDEHRTSAENDEDNDIFTYEGYKQSHVKDSRISSLQASASVLQSSQKPEYDSQIIGLISIIIIIAVVLLGGIAFGIWWYVGYRRYRGEDGLNMSSSVPGSSITFYQYAADRATYEDDNYDSSCHVIRQSPDSSLPHSRCSSEYMFRQNDGHRSSPSEVVLVSLKSCSK